MCFKVDMMRNIGARVGVGVPAAMSFRAITCNDISANPEPHAKVHLHLCS